MPQIKPSQNDQILRSYYRLHAPLYDATRWSFLFGRRPLINDLPDLPENPRILEIGCGTGSNIAQVQSAFPRARITGIDLSLAMLKHAGKRLSSSDNITLVNQKYGSADSFNTSFDLILLSYSLTMMSVEMESIIRQIPQDLSPNGYVAIVDFHATPFRFFEKWMNKNHVAIDGSLLPLLKKHFTPDTIHVQPAYFGLWSYLRFIGKR